MVIEPGIKRIIGFVLFKIKNHQSNPQGTKLNHKIEISTKKVRKEMAMVHVWVDYLVVFFPKPCVLHMALLFDISMSPLSYWLLF